jgi:hypothetical protein
MNKTSGRVSVHIAPFLWKAILPFQTTGKAEKHQAQFARKQKKRTHNSPKKTQQPTIQCNKAKQQRFHPAKPDFSSPGVLSSA